MNGSGDFATTRTVIISCLCIQIAIWKFGEFYSSENLVWKHWQTYGYRSSHKVMIIAEWFCIKYSFN